MVKIETTNNNIKREGCISWDCWLCDSKFINKSKFRKHLFDRHHIGGDLNSNNDIAVNWFHCDQVGCNYKCKQKTTLKQHKENIHDIGVIWFYCDQDGCNYKCKQKGNLKKHRRYS